MGNLAGITLSDANPLKSRFVLWSLIAAIISACLFASIHQAKSYASSFIHTELQNHALDNGVLLTAEAPKIELSRSSLTASFTNVSMSHANIDSRLHSTDIKLGYPWKRIIAGNSTPLNVRITDSALTLVRSDSDHWLNDSGQSATPVTMPQSDSIFDTLTTPLSIPDTNIEVQQAVVTLTDIDRTQVGELYLQGELVNTPVTSRANLKLSGKYRRQKVASSLTYTTENRTLLTEGTTLTLNGGASSARIKFRLLVKDVVNNRVNLISTIKGEDLRELMSTIDGPNINIINGATELSFEKHRVDADNMVLSIDETDIKAGISVIDNRAGTDGKHQLNLTIDANYLPVDQLLSGQRKQKKRQNKKNQKRAPELLFSSSPLLLYRWAEHWTAAVKVQVARLHYLGYEITNLAAQGNIENKKSYLTLSSPDFASGTLKANAMYDASRNATPHGVINISLSNASLDNFSVDPDINDVFSSGTFTAESELWLEGISAAELAGSLNGDFYLLLEDGRMDSMTAELIGVDIMESLSLLIRKKHQSINVKCGYANMNFDNGKGQVEHFFVDSDDTLFNATGTVDLDSEKLNLKITPIPHDSSFFTATTPFHIKGTLSKPKIRPGKKLYARLAAAAVLVSLTGPAAALIPFIGIGDGNKSSSCNDLFTAG